MQREMAIRRANQAAPARRDGAPSGPCCEAARPRQKNARRRGADLKSNSMRAAEPSAGHLALRTIIASLSLVVACAGSGDALDPGRSLDAGLSLDAAAVPVPAPDLRFRWVGTEFR